jgi:hypothetical protein
MTKLGHHINGQFVSGQSGNYTTVHKEESTQLSLDGRRTLFTKLKTVTSGWQASTSKSQFSMLTMK